MSLLATDGLTAFYGDFQALFGIDFRLDAGETVAIIGSNGAGKTTFLRSLAGLLHNAPGMVTFDSAPIGAMPAHEVLRLGIATVPEGRLLFPSLSVEENLRIGAGRRTGPWDIERVFTLFPILRERRRQMATTMSGGQQQMVAIGRALMTNPRVLLCDEISLGLAPIIVRDIYAAIPAIEADGTSLVIVEQDISRALSVADRVYCFQMGRVSLTGTPAETSREAISAAYFGL